MSKPLPKLLGLLSAVLILSTLSGLKAVAQLKIGTNPTQIQKSAILELESDRQGLLLTRLTDTALINAISPAPLAGMIIYLSKTPNPGLYLRTAGGYWQQLSGTGQDSTYWRLTGNTGTDSTKDYLGTTDAHPVSIRANNTEAIHITQNGFLELPNVQSTTDSLQVLVIDPANGNIIEKKALSAAAFEDAIRFLNGLKNEGITLKADSSTTSPALGFTANSSDSSVNLSIPVVNGTTQTAGLLSYSDYMKFDSVASVNWTSAFSGTSNANGVTVDNVNHVITLHAADATNPGAVTTGTQTFAGNKTFNNNLVVNQNASVSGATSLDSSLSVLGNSTFSHGVTVSGNDSVAGNTALSGNIGSTLTISNMSNAGSSDGNTVLIRNSSGTILQKQLQQSAFKQLQTGISGTDVNIDSSNANSIIINVPDAGASSRGVVNTGTQTFGGNKTFADSLTVGSNSAKKFLIVNGAATVSDSLKITGNTTVGGTLALSSTPSSAGNGQNYVLVRDSVTGNIVQRYLDNSAFKTLNMGRDSSKGDLYIDSSSSSKIIINAPDASATVRGVINDTTQVFGGNKSYANSVAIGTSSAPTSTVQVNGSFALAIQTVTANYTVTGNDNTILANTTSGAFTVTLPATSGLSGRIYTIKKIGSGGIDNALTIQPSGGATIDGGTNYTIYNDYTFVSLQTDGTNWYIIKR